MICTISFTICGLKTSLLVSFLDKHTPWISGRPAYLLLNLHPIITRKTTLTQLTNYHAAEKITKKITKPSLKFKLSLKFEAEFQHQLSFGYSQGRINVTYIPRFLDYSIRLDFSSL